MSTDLMIKTIKVSSHQFDWAKERCSSFSRYVRTLIDKEMGAEEARVLTEAKSKRYDNGVTEQKAIPQGKPVSAQYDDGNTIVKLSRKATVWNIPK